MSSRRRMLQFLYTQIGNVLCHMWVDIFPLQVLVVVLVCQLLLLLVLVLLGVGVVDVDEAVVAVVCWYS